MGVGIESTERAGGSAAMAAVPSRCARIGGRSLIGSVRWYDSSHPSLADTLKDLGDQANHHVDQRVQFNLIRHLINRFRAKCHRVSLHLPITVVIEINRVWTNKSS